MAATPQRALTTSRARRVPHRRRQRSVRVTVALSLLTTATVLVLLSLPTRSVLWLSLASVTALVLSWAALRMMWTEVAQSRRENAADRAAAALAYRDLFTARAAEHAEFTTAMTERLAQAQLDRRHLQGMLERQRDRADDAEARLASATRAAAHDDPDVVELARWDAEAGRRSGPAASLRQA